MTNDPATLHLKGPMLLEELEPLAGICTIGNNLRQRKLSIKLLKLLKF